MARRGRPPGSSKRGDSSPAGGASSALFGAPKCPKELDEVAKKKWKEIAKLMAAMGTQTKADRDTMTLYCTAYSRWYAADAKLAQFGPVLKSKEGGLYRSPYLDVAIQAAKEMQNLSRALGLDAVSRKKLGKSEQTEPIQGGVEPTVREEVRELPTEEILLMVEFEDPATPPATKATILRKLVEMEMARTSSQAPPPAVNEVQSPPNEGGS